MGPDRLTPELELLPHAALPQWKGSWEEVMEIEGLT